ncbi:tRNA-dihydrouridine synthase B [Desulfonatronum thiosulfatophilum]|uniref:tRNA-dihydrouridine synthase n=1 Tax=Desulfonatronum thiosulfatophilum TaxID=617002 RepID=A0A1G6ER32_9BACT|nr:tRNA-dihydrouridine synthase family protein [Desulfonatronum thiosulfatophilum]SDB59860.1 tRNA-dihydrouridine synthase B [Desulfonatronum thiosulfatophilum]
MSIPPLPIAPESPWLAPLAGFSDLPFRLLCREQGCRVACTEMVSAKGLIFGNVGTERILVTSAMDAPLVVQLYGPDPRTLEQAMDLLLERDVSYFDFNCGCSVPKVTKTGCGAALLRTPQTLLEIVRSMVARAGPGRVGVKLRLGWRPGEEVFLELGRRLEDLGAAWLTLHPRWATQGFSGQADWDSLARLRAHVSIPVIASGDLFTAEDARRCLDQTGVRGVMFARGALWDPAIFRKFLALSPDGDPFCFSAEYSITVVRRHMALAREYLDDRRALLAMRTIAPRYLRHFPGAKALRSRFTMVDSWEQLDDLLESLCENQEIFNPDSQV